MKTDPASRPRALVVGRASPPRRRQEITVVSWGGAYGASQMEAYHKPFTARTGIKINSVDADNPATPIKAQVEAGNVTIDVADVEPSDAGPALRRGRCSRCCRSTSCPPAPTAPRRPRTSSTGALYDCGVGTDRLLDPHRLRRDQVRRRGADHHRRLLRPREVPRQARPAQGRQGHARAGADGRRRAAGRGLRHARARPRASTAPSPSSTPSRTRWSGGRPAPSRRSCSPTARW